MAITYVGAGTPVYGEYLEVRTPQSHASSVAGDLLVCITVTVSQQGIASYPVGWTPYLTYDPSPDAQKFRVSYKTAAGGVESSGAITPVDLTNGQRHLSVVLTFRGADCSNPFAGATNVRAASTANIGPITAVTGGIDRSGVIVYGSKMGGSTVWTSVDTLTGDGLTWGEAVDVSSAVSADLGLVVDYAFWPSTAPTLTDKTFTVTGGSSGLSAGGMLLLRSYPLPTAGSTDPILKTETFVTPTTALPANNAVFMSITTGTALAVTSAVSEIFSALQRVAIDLTGAREIKISGWHTTGNHAAGKIHFQYALPGTDQTEFFDLITAANGFSLAAGSTTIHRVSAWVPIPAAARMMIVPRMVWSGGNDSTAATIKSMQLHWR